MLQIFVILGMLVGPSLLNLEPNVQVLNVQSNQLHRHRCIDFLMPFSSWHGLRYCCKDQSFTATSVTMIFGAIASCFCKGYYINNNLCSLQWYPNNSLFYQVSTFNPRHHFMRSFPFLPVLKLKPYCVAPGM